jgi:hypothetical protein
VRAALLALLMGVSMAACTGQTDPPGSTPSASGSAGPGGAGSLGDRPVNDTPGVSLIADRTTVLLPDGRSHSVASVKDGAVGGFQTLDGWLVQGYGDSALWLLHPDGHLQLIVDKADGPVAVAPDGVHIAWRRGDTLYTGRVDPGATPGVIVDVTSPAPERGHPITLTPSTVVLGYTETGGGIDHWDIWYPGRGDYVPSWDATRHVRAVYGPTPDGTGYYGLVDGSTSGSLCLAQLDPDDDLNPVRTACGMRIAFERVAELSPDGTRLAMHVFDSSGDPALGVVELATVFTTPSLTTVWSGPPSRKFAWEDASTLLAAPIEGGLVRYRLSDTAWENVTRPGLTAATTVTALLPRRYDPAA